MKIIKKGQRWSKEVKCTGRGNGGGGCGAVLQLSENDIYETFPNYYDDCITFCCPECGVETNIAVGANVIPRGKRSTEEERKKIALKKKKNKKDAKLCKNKLCGCPKPLHPSDITRGPFPVKCHEARKILKEFKAKIKK